MPLAVMAAANWKVDAAGKIYVSDSESDDVQNPGWEMGIRIGEARTGWIDAFVRYPWGDPRVTNGSGAEFVAAVAPIYADAKNRYSRELLELVNL